MDGYMLTDGAGHYIALNRTTRKYVPVNDIHDGQVWSKGDTPIAILHSSLNKALRQTYFVTRVVMEANDHQEQDEIRPANPVKPEQSVDKAEQTIEPGEYAERINALLQKINDMKSLMVDIEAQKSKNNRELSCVDLEICDIYHGIEFSNFNAYQGWLIAQSLKEKLKRRRRIKDEAAMLHILEDCKSNLAGFENMFKKLNGLNNRQYTARTEEYGEIFGGEQNGE